ncbi:NUDIX domain-containing protein [Streptomyces zagrosensis]|uniref:ADP-ribose pyrophosphatase YjhB (NUDIX family) n=1 Tax=Streptomyces zagrosensis TaxID=1042984 RepID=A0A7W9QJ77_9ACTN|nr:NUDIX hydrolase [Streptomyces zagrosensis]MBB5939997.1 ADP-ribose pyrophosphatase YjhB (NUDIX family) [Streptomyces zagrosensis]
MSATFVDPSHAKPVPSAGVLCFNEHGHLLLVKPTYKAGWNLPGGRIDLWETPSTAAVREVREELGLDVCVGEPLAIAWVAAPSERVLFLFDAGTLTTTQQAAICLQASELSEYAFYPPEDIDVTTAPPGLLGVLHDALAARATGQRSYTEISG